MQSRNNLKTPFRGSRFIISFVILTFVFPFTAQAAEQKKLTVRHACEKISNKLASVTFEECLSVKMFLTGHHSVNGFPIIMREYPPLKRRSPKGRVLLVGGTHGDELSSISIIFKWMKVLEKHHSGLFHWHISPLMNPDGALEKDHIRMNRNGVDLNRNFLTPGAEGSALDYWQKKTYRNSRRYPGERPLSEPETRWMKKEIDEFRPDVIIAVHAPYSLVDYDAPNRNNAPEKIGYLHKNLMGTYPGSLGNYAGIHLGIPVITLELPHAGIMPSPDQIKHLWTDLVRWLINNV